MVFLGSLYKILNRWCTSVKEGTRKAMKVEEITFTKDSREEQRFEVSFGERRKEARRGRQHNVRECYV